MIGGQVFGLLLLQRSGTGHLSFLYSRSACPHCCISVQVESLFFSKKGGNRIHSEEQKAERWLSG